MKTVFLQKELGGQWYWHTRADNGKIVADGSEGYNRLDGAIHGFLVSQSNMTVSEADVQEFRSKLDRQSGTLTTTYHFTHKSE